MSVKFDLGAEKNVETGRKSFFSTTSSSRPADEVVHVDKLRSLDDGVDTEAHKTVAESALNEKENLVRRVAEAPLSYTTVLPKLADLEISNLWNDFFQEINQDFDMSALTASLSQQLDDEDVPWNPDMLLVQLTSDMLDAAEGGESAVLAVDRAALEAVGEARRRRKVLLEDADETRVAVHSRSCRAAAVVGPQGAEGSGKCPSGEAEKGGEMATGRDHHGGENGKNGGLGKRTSVSNWVSVARDES